MWRKLGLGPEQEKKGNHQKKKTNDPDGPRKDANGIQEKTRRIQGPTNRNEMALKKGYLRTIRQTVSSYLICFLPLSIEPGSWAISSTFSLTACERMSQGMWGASSTSELIKTPGRQPIV